MNSPYAGEKNGNYRHGGYTANRSEYNSWRAMRARCNDPKYRRYDRYGARGITVCDRWNDGLTGFANFLEDMGKKPTPKHTLDRIDNDGNYEPNNCRWATQTEQIRNSSIRKTHVINGVEGSVEELAKAAGISMSLAYTRLKQGYTLEQALTNTHYWSPEERAKRHKAYVDSFPNCPECNAKCHDKRAKFCSSKCYMRRRGRETRLANLHGL